VVKRHGTKRQTHTRALIDLSSAFLPSVCELYASRDYLEWRTNCRIARASKARAREKRVIDRTSRVRKSRKLSTTDKSGKRATLIILVVSRDRSRSGIYDKVRHSALERGVRLKRLFRWRTFSAAEGRMQRQRKISSPVHHEIFLRAFLIRSITFYYILLKRTGINIRVCAQHFYDQAAIKPLDDRLRRLICPSWGYP